MRFRDIFHFKELLHTRKTIKKTKSWRDEDLVLASLAVYIHNELRTALSGKQANPHKLERKYIKAFLKLIGKAPRHRDHFREVLSTAMELKEEGRLPMTTSVTRFNWINLSTDNANHEKIKN
jgi:hypothetical protein